MTGIDIDIINEMSRRIDLKVKIELMPWKRLIDMTQKGYCDGSMSLFKTDERVGFALFTAPVHYSTYVIFVHKNRKFDFNSMKDLYGKRLCKQAGFVISDEFDQAVQEKKIGIVDIFDTDSSLIRVVNGATDGIVANKQVTLFFLKNKPILSKIKDDVAMLPKPVKEARGAFLVISRKSPYPDKVALQQEITKTLNVMQKDGTYSKINAKYFE